MPLTILSPGPLTTVQDEGRFGHLHAGIGRSGAMDARAYRAANALVGNAWGEAVLEATLMGPTIRFEQACSIALTGADMSARLDGQPIPRYACVARAAGRVLEMGFAAAGVRGYLAVRGGIDVPLALGSRSAISSANWAAGRAAAWPRGTYCPLARKPLASLRPHPWSRRNTHQSPCARWRAGRRCSRRKPGRLLLPGVYHFSRCDRMGIRLQGTARFPGGDRHRVRWHRLWRRAGAGQRLAHRADGGSPDHRRLCQDRHRRHGRLAVARAGAARHGGALFPGARGGNPSRRSTQPFAQMEGGAALCHSPLIRPPRCG